MIHHKLILVVLSCLAFVSLVGCNFKSNQSENLNKKAEDDQVQWSHQESGDFIIPEPLPPVENDVFAERMPPPKKEDFFTIVTDIEEYEVEKALSQVIDYHNKNEKASIPFPNNLRVDEMISKEVEVEGNTTLLQVTTEAEKNNNKYIIKLIKDWNVKVDGVDAVSYWKYVIDDSEIKLLYKKEDGKWLEEELLLE